MKKMNEKQQIAFALKQCDEQSRSFIEGSCVMVKRERSKALYKYNLRKIDDMAEKDVKEAILYLKSRGDALPFKVVEEGDFIWFNDKKE